MQSKCRSLNTLVYLYRWRAVAGGSDEAIDGTAIARHPVSRRSSDEAVRSLTKARSHSHRLFSEFCSSNGRQATSQPGLTMSSSRRARRAVTTDVGQGATCDVGGWEGSLSTTTETLRTCAMPFRGTKKSPCFFHSLSKPQRGKPSSRGFC